MMSIASAGARVSVLLCAIVLAMPQQFRAEDAVGGDVGDCTTVNRVGHDCTGCSEDWLKCSGCTAESGTDKEYKCIDGSAECQGTGCTNRTGHAVDDNCVTQECPDPA
jgi:hypothetical protein